LANFTESKNKFLLQRNLILEGFFRVINSQINPTPQDPIIIDAGGNKPADPQDPKNRNRSTKTIYDFAKRKPWILFFILIPVIIFIYLTLQNNQKQTNTTYIGPVKDGAESVKSTDGATLTINYSFHVYKSGKYKEIFNGDTVYSGDNLRITIKSSEKCYLLVLNIDAGERIYTLFPLEDGIASSLTSQKEITIPGDRTFLVADNQKGMEKILILASKDPIDSLQDIIDKYKQANSEQKKQLNVADEINLRGFSKVITEDSSGAAIELTDYKDLNLMRYFSGEDNLLKEINIYHL